MTGISNFSAGRAWPLRLALVIGLSIHAAACHSAGAPLWMIDGQPTPEAVQAVRLLQSAAEDGLNPQDYQAQDLARLVEAAGRGAPLAADGEAAVSAALTGAMEAYLSELHSGRVNPRAVHASFDIPDKHLDAAAYLEDAVADHRLVEAVQAARPQLPLYAGLMQALARYRALEAEPALQQPLPPLPRNKLEPGQEYPGLPALAQRLVALGDLEPEAGDQAGTRYAGAVVEGVMAFQARHGLSADGIIGRNTYAQLNVPIAARIRQIELTLERLRWTPSPPGERMIVVNVPEFVLLAYDARNGGPQISMNVVVGKALDTRTPLFAEEMRFIEFSPYWNIPPSIARAEIVPALRRDPAYFTRQGLEFVRPDGAVVPVLSKANLDAVMTGRLRIRQRPGPDNPLGDIKFIFPNNENIYLHHTPAVQLFRRDRRDFSHGCVRVETPVALARFVLQDQPEWTEDRIRAAMKSGRSTTVRLRQTTPVLITYATAIARRNGKVYFFDDIYGNDALLDHALKARERNRNSTLKDVPGGSPVP
jgi:murein L,D-transpeptidase YcbB/YkuD